jgi:hypothetical protein
MSLVKPPDIGVSQDLLDAVEDFPTTREVTHCGQTFAVSPFEIYISCPTCGTRMKVRAFSAGNDIEDLFDTFFKWLQQPGAAQVAADRQAQIEND